MALAKEGKFWVERDSKGKELSRSRVRPVAKPKKKAVKKSKEEGA